MPRTPLLSSIASNVRASNFTPFVERLQSLAAQGELIPLHIGDTHVLPPPAARHIDLERAEIYRLGMPEGDGALRGAVERRLHRLYGFDSRDNRIFIAPGGTGAVSIAAEAVFDPGDEVIVLTPTWPIIFGVLERRGVVIREVAVGPDGWPGDFAAFRHGLRNAVTPRTAGIYLCDPNNPSGFLLPQSFVAEIAALAVEHELWILSDVAYADSILTSGPYSPMLADPRLAGRCLTAGSFTKSFGLAGLRVGYIAAPEALSEIMNRLLTHSTLHTSSAGQAMALACLGAQHDTTIIDSYRQGADLVGRHLHAKFRAPEAGAFVFLDLRPLGIQNHDQTLTFLERCLDEGVSLCPGNAFGTAFEPFARLCYTIVPEDILLEAIQRINRVIANYALPKTARA